MEFERVKSQIKEISEIAAGVPETFREVCFKVLLEALVSESEPREESGGAPPVRAPESASHIPTPSQVKVFMGRTGVTQEELDRVLLFDRKEVHFLREPTHKTVAKGQIEWALLLALKSAVEKNVFEVDPEDVRSICQEKGYYDSANFASQFKKDKNIGLFKKPPVPQGDPQPLTTEGQKALGKLIKKLAGVEE